MVIIPPFPLLIMFFYSNKGKEGEHPFITFSLTFLNPNIVQVPLILPYFLLYTHS